MRAAIISNRRITGLTADVIAQLVAKISLLWHEATSPGARSGAQRPQYKRQGPGSPGLRVRALRKSVRLPGKPLCAPMAWLNLSSARLMKGRSRAHGR